MEGREEAGGQNGGGWREGREGGWNGEERRGGERTGRAGWGDGEQGKREAGITETQMIAARWAGGKRGKVAKRGE